MTSFFSTGESSTSLLIFDTGIIVEWTPSLINMTSNLNLSVGKSSLINSNSSMLSNINILSGSSIKFDIIPWNMQSNLYPSVGKIINLEIGPWSFFHEQIDAGGGGAAFFVTDSKVIEYPPTAYFSTSELNAKESLFRLPFRWNMQENFLTFFGKSAIIEGEMEMILNQEGPLARRSRVQGQVIMSGG